MPAPSPARGSRGEPPARSRRHLAGLALALALTAVAACAKRPGDLVTAAPAAPEATPAAEGHLVGEDAERLDDSAPDRDATPADALALADYERLLGQQEARLHSLGRRDEAREAERATRAPTADWAGAGGGAAGGDSVAGSPPPSTPSRPSAGKAPTSSRPVSKSTDPAAKNRKKEAAADEADACLMICDIAAATCDLEQRICDLASRHPAEPRYAQVCARAREDCQLASRSCEGCAA